MQNIKNLTLRKCCSNRQNEPFCSIFAHFWASKKFPKKNWLHQSNPEKNPVVTGKQINWAILTNFGPNKNFLKRFGTLSLKNLGSHNFTKNITKTNEPIPRKIRASWVTFACFQASEIFLKKLSSLSFEYYDPSTSCKI